MIKVYFPVDTEDYAKIHDLWLDMRKSNLEYIPSGYSLLLAGFGSIEELDKQHLSHLRRMVYRQRDDRVDFLRYWNKIELPTRDEFKEMCANQIKIIENVKNIRILLFGRLEISVPIKWLRYFRFVPYVMVLRMYSTKGIKHIMDDKNFINPKRMRMNEHTFIANNLEL